ncbi:MAG: hypothetical protein JWO31_2522 [Phycisphaerales bacterium]|nr:hypothetical protein [Phycisphaerales bacterium]
MSKPSLVYLAVFVLCVGGVWGILRAGAGLQAVADLTGDWRVESGPLGPGPGGPERLGESFSVDQSGRFLRVRFSGGRVLDLKATTAPLGRLGDDPVTFELVNGRQHMTATVRRDPSGHAAGSFVLTGPETAAFVARRAPPGEKETEPGPPPVSQGATAGPTTQPEVTE